jgi:hypothetical protein
MNQKNDANEILKVDELYIQLLPEYKAPVNWDENYPSLLVSCIGEITNYSNTEYDEYIQFPVPTDSSMFTLSLVCETKKGILNRPYEVEDGYVAWKPSEPIPSMGKYTFMIDYYFNPSDDLNGVREFDYSFFTKATIPQVNIDVYMPTSSTSHMLVPTPTEHFIINNGISVYSYLFNNVDANNPVNIEFNYNIYNNTSKSISEIYSYSNDFNAPVNFNLIGIIIFSLILMIIGISVISLSGNNKIRIVENGRDSEKRNDDLELRKKSLRKLLIEGKISEHTYKSLLEEK